MAQTPRAAEARFASPSLAGALARLSPQQRDRLGLALARSLVAALEQMAGEDARRREDRAA